MTGSSVGGHHEAQEAGVLTEAVPQDRGLRFPVLRGGDLVRLVSPASFPGRAPTGSSTGSTATPSAATPSRWSASATSPTCTWSCGSNAGCQDSTGASP